MRKQWWIIGLATLAIAGGLAVAILTLQPLGPGVTEANQDRIEHGMSEADVEAILGKPADTWQIMVSAGVIADKQWRAGNGAYVEITFINGAVVRSQWYESTETITDKLRRWLSLPKNRSRRIFQLHLCRQASQ